MKLYKCKMLDESLCDWTDCIVAVMQNYAEQNYYYANINIHRTKTWATLLEKSGYSSYSEDDIEFWFACEMNGLNYADSISKNIPQRCCDTDYADFEYIEPDKDRCMYCKEMFDLFCAKAKKNVLWNEFHNSPYKPNWCPGRTPAATYRD